jgi:hypothetical protein
MNKPIKLHSIPILFPVLIVILSSCSNYPENLKVIPKETNVVSVIDIYSIVKKGNLNEISDFKFYKNLRKEIREDNKKFSRLIDNLFEDPTYSGINLKTELIAFYTDEAEDESFFGLSVELENHENFLEFLVESLEDLNIDFYLDKEKNYYHITIEEESIIGWDNKKAVLLIAENNKSEKYLDYKVDLLMDLTENNQILENENFKNFFQNKEDLSFWFSKNLFENPVIPIIPLPSKLIRATLSI